MNANKIKEENFTFCTCKWSDKNTEIKIKKKNPTKGVSYPRNPTSRSADVSGFTFLSPNVLPDKYFTKNDIYIRD